jgi:hypothetical protein
MQAVLGACHVLGKLVYHNRKGCKNRGTDICVATVWRSILLLAAAIVHLSGVPQAVSQAAHHPLCSRVSLLHLLCLAVNVLQHEAHKLYHCNDEAAKRDRAQMVQDGDLHACPDWQSCHIGAKAPLPVVLPYTVCYDNISKADNELIGPQQTKDVIRQIVLHMHTHSEAVQSKGVIRIPH